jgi:hypothetical protein
MDQKMEYLRLMGIGRLRDCSKSNTFNSNIEITEVELFIHNVTNL